MLHRISLSDVVCCREQRNFAGKVSLIGQDFLYEWNTVREYAIQQEINLDDFLVMPISVRLFERQLKSPVLFWFTPLNDLFVVTVCSKRNTCFMDPLHTLPGYVEYGESFLRPNARPLIYWNGTKVIRTHSILVNTNSEYLVADFGNLFGLTVSDATADEYEKIVDRPKDYFEYCAVPRTREKICHWNGDKYRLEHALCLLDG